MRHLFEGGDGPITSEELAELMALNAIDPYAGELRDDQRSAMIASMIANTNGGTTMKLDDFILHNPDDNDVDSVESMMAFCESFTRSMGGEVIG